MPLIRELSILALAGAGALGVATWAWHNGQARGMENAERDGQLLFSRGVAFGHLKALQQMCGGCAQDEG